MMLLSEAARLLDVTTGNLRQQIANGRLAAVRRGRDWYVSNEEVERYRKEHLRAR